MSNPIMLSISMLASRKKQQVKRCLDSLIPVMEQIPSELIIVDTSKDAEVHKMLLEYTDKVVEFTWCNDFSKARNAGLQLAKGEWFLYIDDDEWFADIDELLSFFQSGEYREYGCANYIQRNFHDLDYTHYTDCWASRMIRIGKNTCFKSKIHEYLYPQEGECKNLHVIANHSGYIYQTAEDLENHFKRNYPLLLDMMKEEPERLRWRVHIVQELYSVKRWSELQKFCEDSLVFCRDRTDEWDSRDVGTFCAGLVESLMNQQEYEKALQAADQTFADARTSKLCQAYVALLMARCYYALENYEQTRQRTKQYFSLKRELEKNRKSLEIQQGALLVGDAFSEILVKRAYSFLIACGLQQKDAEPLKKYLPKLEWNQKVIYVSDEIFPALIDGMASLPQESVFVEAMQLMWDNEELGKKMFPAIQNWEQKDRKGFERLISIAAQVQGEHWYLWYAKILAADWKNDAAELPEAFLGFCLRTPNVFATPENVISIMNQYHLSMEEGYLAVPFAKWEDQLREYIAEVPLQDILLTELSLQSMKTREDVRYDYAFMRLAEARAVLSEKQKNYNTKHNCLADFARLGSTYVQKYYTDDVREKWRELLPEYQQAALILQEALAAQETNLKHAAQLFREAAVTDTELAGAVKSYLTAMEEETRNRKQRAKEELRELEEKVKKQVEQCLKDGQYTEALSILKELRELKPNELYVAELTLRARLGQLNEQGI